MDLALWWRTIRPRCHPAFPDVALSPDELERQLGERIAALRPSEPIARRIALSAGFKSYLALLGASSWLGQRVRLDFLMRSPAAILAEVEGNLGSYERDAVLAAGFWLPFASAGKTTWFFCCDATRPALGSVAEGEDAHPWDQGISSLGEPIALSQWLQEVAQRPVNRTERWVLMALERSEAEELARARASADPWELLVCVRDLECRLTPDPAWKHAVGAPQRVRLLNRDALREVSLPGREIYRDEKTCASLLSFGELETLGPVPPYAVGAWEPDGQFGRVAAAHEDLRKFVSRARQSCVTLLLTQDLTPVYDGPDE